MGPRYRARCHRDPWGSTPGDRAARPRAPRRSHWATRTGLVLADAFLSLSPRPLDALADPGRPDVVVVMGIPGAGKSRVAAEHAARGYLRLNRDERGGALRALAGELDATLASGATRVVLDNTYLTRAARRDIIDAAVRHGAERPLHLDRHAVGAGAGEPRRATTRPVRAAPDPDENRAHPSGSRACWRRRPRCARCVTSSRRRTTRGSPPSSVSRSRGHRRRYRRAVPSSSPPPAMREPGWKAAVAQGDPAAPAPRLRLAPRTGHRTISSRRSPSCRASWPRPESAVCPHGGGAPICWCRPPLPGLLLAFARTHGVDAARSTLIGTSAAHRTLATTLGARYVEP